MIAPAIYFGSRILAAVVGIASIALFTRLITPEDYGIFALAMSGVVTVFEIAYQWIRAGMLRFLPRAETVAGPAMAAAVLGYIWTSAALFVVTLLATLMPGLSERWYLLWLCYGLLLAMAGLELALTALQAREKVVAYGILTLVRALGMLAGGTALVMAGLGAYGILLGYLAAMALPVLCLAAAHGPKLAALPFRQAELGAMFRFGGAMAIVGIAGSIIGLSDRYMIAWLVDVGEAGLYGAPYDLTHRGLKLLLLSAFLAFSPAVFRSFDNSNEQALQATLRVQIRLMAGVALPIGFALAVAAPLVARLFLGEAFRAGAIELIPWLVAAALIQGTAAYYLSYGYTLPQKVIHNAVVVSACAVLNVVLNALMIPSMGGLGAAIATLITVALLFTVSLMLTRRWIVLPWHLGDLARIGAICALTGPLIYLAARQETLVSSVLATGAACLLMLLLLVAANVGDVRRTAGARFRQLRRRQA